MTQTTLNIIATLLIAVSLNGQALAASQQLSSIKPTHHGITGTAVDPELIVASSHEAESRPVKQDDDSHLASPQDDC